MSTVTSRDGTSIAVGQTGDGPALVLVDGALCHSRFGPMPALTEHLAPHFTVHAYDRRGRGESGDTPPYAVEREVEDLAAVIEATGGPARVFGLSSGAALALEAAASGLPIAKLALYEPPFAVEPEDPEESRAYNERLAELIAEGRNGDAVAHFLGSAGVPPEALEEMRAQPSWPSFEAVAPTLLYDHAVLGDGAVPAARAAAVTAPTLVANGADSPPFFQDAARATAAAIPGAEHRALEGQSWGRVEPAPLAELLVRFLR
jgi:pimeloyl-ACP methyl ester carboxylesterase